MESRILTCVTLLSGYSLRLILSFDMVGLLKRALLKVNGSCLIVQLTGRLRVEFRNCSIHKSGQIYLVC